MCFIYFTCPLYQLALEHGSSVYLKRNMFINPKKCNWNLPKGPIMRRTVTKMKYELLKLNLNCYIEFKILLLIHYMMQEIYASTHR